VTDKVVSLTLVILGVIAIAVCLFADVLGIGSAPSTIGWKQYSGATIGVMMIFLGAHIAYHHSRRQ
jgi:TRAP-type C4-dicarboxylate transport system permease small subunit